MYVARGENEWFAWGTIDMLYGLYLCSVFSLCGSGVFYLCMYMHMHMHMHMGMYGLGTILWRSGAWVCV